MSLKTTQKDQLIPIPTSYSPIVGELNLIIGPIFSGKTTELLRRIRRYKIRDDLCVILKPDSTKFDQQDSKVISHNCWNYLQALPCNSLFQNQFYDLVQNSDVIGIDQGHFFPDLVEFSELMADSGKIVIVAGLDSDNRRQPFWNICALVAKADSVTKLTSICLYCKGEGTFNIKEEIQMENQTCLQNENYIPVCRKCYLQTINAPSLK